MIRNYTNSRQNPQLWVEIMITVLGLLGAITFFVFYETAFPNASMDVSISRGQAKQLAGEYLKQLGYSVEDYRFALSFSSDSQAAYYLQRTLGIEEYNLRLAREKWSIYYWSARWFKPLEKEEFRVYLMPDGTLLGWNHIIKEDTPGASITQEDALRIAETFLSKNANWKSNEWERMESSSQTKPGGRVDHTFTWKSSSYSAGQSELRYTTLIQGDQVDLAYKFIKVPESFTRQFASERNLAGFINDAAYFTILLGCSIISLIAIALSRPDIRRAITPALLVAGATLAAYLNFLPLYKSSYGTTENYSLFWLDIIVSIIFSVIFAGTQAFILLLGAQSLARFVWPKQDRILARGTEQCINFSRSAWRGLMLGGIQLAYVLLFYAIAKNYFGWWSPISTEYSDIFATPFPFFYALRIGLNAALIEELSVRFIGIGFLLWLFHGKQKWLAILIPSLIWAFAHTGYVTSPIYARGIELTLVALFLSLIFLKFDLLTTIMSHFTYNMMVTGVILLRSNEAYYQISGWIVIIALTVPLIPGLYMKIRRYLRKEPSASEKLTLSPIHKSDLVQLSNLPVKADWQALLNQANRLIHGLCAGAQVIGFVTGVIDDKKIGYVDGVYIAPKWRRQYLGTALLEAMQEDLRNCGASEIRVIVKPNETRIKSFLHNLFWRTSIQILNKDASEQTFMTAMKNLVSDLKEEKSKEYELEIPRNLI